MNLLHPDDILPLPHQHLQSFPHLQQKQHYTLLVKWQKGGTQKFPELLKNLFTIFVQVWNFSPLQSTPPVTGYNDPSTTPTAGNIV
jgi:hypothetical protein